MIAMKAAPPATPPKVRAESPAEALATIAVLLCDVHGVTEARRVQRLARLLP